MPVHIKEIHVQNLGPITKFAMKPGVLNLIYGRNEQGKTHLVEFLIRSLFRSTKTWTLRSLKGNGKVHVDGLEAKQVEFFPESRIKIDDLWQESMPGLPPDFSRLLVVKGAEVELSTSEAKTDKAIIKKYLSSQEFLDRIDQKISQTIKDAQVQTGTITAKKMGEGNRRSELEKQLDTLDQLFKQIDIGYSGGGRKNLDDQMERLTAHLDKIETAKRYLAYKLSQQKESLEENKNKMDEQLLQKIKDNLGSFRHKIEDMKHRKEMLGKSQEKSQHYGWLKQAVEQYTGLLNRRNRSPRLLLLYAGLFALLCAAGFTIFKLLIGVFVSLVAALVCVLLHILVLPKLTQEAIHSAEMERLKKSFKTRFQSELTDLAVLTEKYKNQEAEYSKTQVLREQIEKGERDLETLKSDISEQMTTLTGGLIKPSQWQETVIKIERKLLELHNKISKLKLELAPLGVDHSDYVTEDPGIVYNKKESEEIRIMIRDLESQISEENNKLEVLKNHLVNQTGDNITSQWENLIENLRIKRNEVTEAFKSLTAEIIGKKMVHEALVALQKGEDAKIITGLQSKSVLDHLSRFTGERYRSIDLNKEDIIVSSKTNNFRLSDLSTGAREQTMLALRIGFASKLFNQSLFLILDDAFQYSDWQRRQWLMDAMIDLTQNGWQILYFTMDDHIRGLFEEKSRNFKEKCKIVELPH